MPDDGRTFQAGSLAPGAAVAHVAGEMLLVAESAAIYRLGPVEARRVAQAIDVGPDETGAVLGGLGLAADTSPPVHTAEPGPIRALALTVAQSCNLACGYCYASGGSFGGPEGRMRWEVARTAIDRLIASAPPGGAVKIAFMGGEPLVARALIRKATEHARTRAASRAVRVGFSLTTNATLLTPEDADFFARHRFAVTVSLDGGREVNDRLRPARGGGGSFDRAVVRLAPLVARRDAIVLSARVTATPENLDIPQVVADLGAAGFTSVGVSPLLAAPGGRGALGPGDFGRLLDGMIACGEDWMEATLAKRAHPFANLATALVELHRGQARSHSCGAVRDYLAVDASGAYAACHRFVNDARGAMGSLGTGVDEAAREAFLADRAVERQAPCRVCWARRLCGGGCHHEVLNSGRPACDYVRGWLDHALRAYGRLLDGRPEWFDETL